jgi:small nuclear ribonucleoprotein (snRNP)-like protein
VRWEDLFADLERQWEALGQSERQAEVAERTRAEFARVRLVDRLRGSEARQVALVTRGGQALTGELSRVGPDFVLVSTGRHECVVPLDAIRSVRGLGAATVSAEAVGPVQARLGLASVLRTIAADRSVVTVVTTDDRALSGTLQRVGSDFVELLEHPVDATARAAQGRGLTLMPFVVVALVRRESP